MSLLTNAGDLAIKNDLKQFLMVLLVALSAAILPKIVTSLRQFPYTLLLVIVGLGLALLDVRLISLSPGMILLLFLPPLLFEAAWNMKWEDLRQEVIPSGLFAIGGVFVSIAGVGWALHQWVSVPWITALLVGSCLSATDSASVIGLFRELGAGKRLTTLLEGESLFNDGASVVAFGVLVELAVDAHPVDSSTIILHFLVVTSIGLGVGGLIGACIAFLAQRYTLSWVEQSLTLVTAYGTYLLVEELGGSGVIGVVAAGLMLGNFSSLPGVPPIKRATITEFWEFLVFFVNSIVFLLLGDQIQLPRLIQNFETTAIAILAIVVSRAITIYGFSLISGWLTKTTISLPEQTVIWWAGLRGGVSIALALSIPVAVVGREEIIANSFGVVLFTLLVQGLTTKTLLEKLNLLEDQTLHQQYLELIARRDALQQVLNHLDQTELQSAIEPALHHSQIEFLKQKFQHIKQEIELMTTQYSQLKAFNLQQHQEKLLAIEADTYAKFIQSGLLKQPLTSIVQTAFDA
ncbi:cation:proton antiporter [Phormidium sp. CLA17]|uniref:cation:proton antiporter n=1 Tax=Leptolyngbya sp. Cla-17 TaxID=2803751 RepID=UPI001491E62A|nr:sodium:proton antiporter [Leptolyngbya sp. Cla-17]MBM0743115.1 cation:proton antiporter [Leptolyngbya sp. Cla-17]